MRGLLGELISESHQLTVADMEAGLEHMSRSDGTLRHIDLLLVVLEPYRKALETGRRTLSLAAGLGITRVYGVANKVRDAAEAAEVEAWAAGMGLPVMTTVPFDDAAREADREGVALLDLAPDCPAVTSISGLLDSVQETLAAV